MIPAPFNDTLYHELDKLKLPADAVTQFFDARGIPCPMPLLKAKVALRSVAPDQALYLLASDKNSQTDLVAFCQKNHYRVHTWLTQTSDSGVIYHFIIQKPS